MEETFHDYTYAEALNLRMQAVRNSALALFDYLNKMFEPLMKALTECLEKFNAWLYQQYLEDGAMYGATSGSMQHWLEERIGENQSKQELEARGMGYGQKVPIDYLLYLGSRLKRRLN